MDHIATIGWVLKEVNIDSASVGSFKLANRLLINIFNVTTRADGYVTLTYAQPYIIPPVVTANVNLVRIGQSGATTISLLNPTSTTIQVGTLYNGALIDSLVYLIAIGFAA